MSITIQPICSRGNGQFLSSLFELFSFTTCCSYLYCVYTKLTGAELQTQFLSGKKKSLSDSNSVSTQEKNFGVRRHKRHFWTLHCLFTKCLNGFHIRVLNHNAERLKNCCRCCTRHRWTSMHFTVCFFLLNVFLNIV